VQHPVLARGGHAPGYNGVNQAQVEHVQQRVSKHERQQLVKIGRGVIAIAMWVLQYERLQFRYFVRRCLNQFQPGAYCSVVVFRDPKHLEELRLIQHVRIHFIVFYVFKQFVCAHEIGDVHVNLSI